MKKILIMPFLGLTLMAAQCGHVESAGTKVVYQTVDREVMVECPAHRIPHPKGIQKPLPSDPGALVSLLTAKVVELLGKGGYADQVDALQNTCKIK